MQSVKGSAQMFRCKQESADEDTGGHQNLLPVDNISSMRRTERKAWMGTWEAGKNDRSKKHLAPCQTPDSCFNSVSMLCSTLWAKYNTSAFWRRTPHESKHLVSASDNILVLAILYVFLNRDRNAVNTAWVCRRSSDKCFKCQLHR